MHETAVAASMVRLVAQAAEGARARRVVRIRLRLGEGCRLEAGALESAFVRAARGTPAEGCGIEVRVVEGEGAWIESLDVDVPRPPA